MRAFACPNCQSPIHFEARVCPACKATLGYDPAIDAFRFLADKATVWRDAASETSNVVVCANNNDFAICNWLVGDDVETGMCRACRHNRTIPDLSDANVPKRWARVEAAKRRLIRTLLRLGLPLETKAEEVPGRQGLAFDFLHDPAAEGSGQAQVLTGHDSGVITLNLIEANDAERERMRAAMGEPYRTLLGHFRHEIGHHYWARLVQNDPEELQAFRAIFGDERINYAEALSAHYADSGKVWTDAYVSYYATSHPWEDFAETWAHYLHIVDVLATASDLDLSLKVPDADKAQEVELAFDPYRADAAKLATHMEPLAFAMNAMNRSMGQDDLYPFALSDAIVKKLDYVARLVATNRADA